MDRQRDTTNIQNKFNNERIYLLDYLKGVAVFLVVFGHSIQYGNGQEYSFFSDRVFQFIYTFHMPLFALISGYLFCFTIKKYHAKKIVKNKCISLLIPILTYSILTYSILTFILNREYSNITSYTELIFYFLSFFMSKLWFVWAMFYLSMIILLVNQIFKDNIFAYIVIYILCFISPDLFNTELYKFLYPFFLLGYLYNKYNVNQKIQNKIYCGFVGLLAFIVLFPLCNPNTFIYTSGFTIIGKKCLFQIWIDLYRVIMGLLGSVWFILLINGLSKYVNHEKIQKVIASFGEFSLGIYIFQHLFCKILSSVTKGNSEVNYFSSLLYAILIMLVCLCISKFIRRVNVLNFLFLGKR